MYAFGERMVFDNVPFPKAAQRWLMKATAPPLSRYSDG